MNSGLRGGAHNFFNVLSDWVRKRHQRKEGLVLLEVSDLVLTVNVSVHLGHHCLEAMDTHIAVGHGEGAETV